MSRLDFTPTTFSSRLVEIDSALNTKGKWVNDRLQVVNKENGFLRFMKVIILPLARMFGSDPFGHVRIYTVALVLLEQYQLHKNDLSAEDAKAMGNILGKMDTKTHKKYHRTLNVYLAIYPSETYSPTPLVQMSKGDPLPLLTTTKSKPEANEEPVVVKPPKFPPPLPPEPPKGLPPPLTFKPTVNKGNSSGAIDLSSVRLKKVDTTTRRAPLTADSQNDMWGQMLVELNKRRNGIQPPEPKPNPLLDDIESDWSDSEESVD